MKALALAGAAIEDVEMLAFVVVWAGLRRQLEPRADDVVDVGCRRFSSPVPVANPI